ncbi:MAG: CocE/NonD family hydrolase, partial [Gemmatimonadaceae bacterium]|nr:CocE/NonD family hydrolase [Gemmatimonadaceae bacterium]
MRLVRPSGLPTVVLAAVLVVAPWRAPRAQQPDTAAGFDMQEVMIPMRDGVKLHTTIFVPRGAHEALPFILTRTPYGIAHAAGNLSGYYRALAADGYIFVFQDIRGRYGSEGHFVMMRPPRDRRDPKAIDESTDTYDTIDWLLTHVPGNNGRVGMLGISYPGWLTVMAMLDPHPALKAVSPQASPADMFLGDDFHHNGAFRLSYGFEYATMMETSKENTQFAFDRYDTYQWYLDLGPLSNVNAVLLHGKIPTWNDFVAHPNYDAFWQRQAVTPYLTRVTVPTLNVAGWWDQEDFYGPIRIYEALETHDTQHLNYLVVGPWNHGGWARSEGDKLGAIPFGSPTSRYFQEKILAPWFAHFLKDRGEWEPPEALTFEAGSNQWRSWDAWPPKAGTTTKTLYFHAGGKLSFDPPAPGSRDTVDRFV